ncbi:hypothetical protein VTK56DRAFT_2801 [Thermocarpiscus australiensis]
MDDSDELQRRAYDALVADGGRPSHPLQLLKRVVIAPGEFRDILTCWQDRPDEWQVFTKQLKRWRDFRAFQLFMRQKNQFPDYANELGAYLGLRRGFTFPPSFRTAAPCGLREDPTSQGKLATWIEYLYYEYREHDKYEKHKRGREQLYLQAWNTLVKSGVLHPSEDSISTALDICSPSSMEIARQMYEKRQVRYRIGDLGSELAAAQPPQSRTPEGHRLLALAERRFAEAKRNLELMDKRAKQLLDFKKKIEPYRAAKEKTERHEALVKWTLDQVPLIEKEEGLTRADPLPSIDVPTEDTAPAAPQTFAPFIRLPAELRQQIWLECLPPRPTAHFFEVLNHPRKRHMAPYWSTQEFRVRATRGRDSGYRVVYALLATCREARIVVAAHYRRLQLGTAHDGLAPPSNVDGDHERESSESNRQRSAGRAGSEPWCYPFPVFQTFDWIPADDLIVLCFPPKQARLPATHAITFARGPARHVGLLLPMEVLMKAQFGLDYGDGQVIMNENRVDDESQITLIPEFLKTLRAPGVGETTRRGTSENEKADSGTAVGGGVKMAFVLFEGWNAYDGYRAWIPSVRNAAARREWLAQCRKKNVSWGFEGARRDETCVQWKWQTPDKNYTLRRRYFWWLGSGHNALAAPEIGDIMERSPGSRVLGYAGVVGAGCRASGWREFEGANVLGWIVPELPEVGHEAMTANDGERRTA